MKRINIIFLLFSIFSSMTVFSATCPAGKYPLLCRGKVPMETRALSGGGPNYCMALLVYPDTALATGAGSNGEKLRPGTCAFVDRPVNAYEMEHIYLDWCKLGGGEVPTMPAPFAIFHQCLTDKDCAVQVCGIADKNAEGKRLFFVNPHHPVRTFYPY